MYLQLQMVPARMLSEASGDLLARMHCLSTVIHLWLHHPPLFFKCRDICTLKFYFHAGY